MMRKSRVGGHRKAQVVTALLLIGLSTAGAQTDFYNTDRGRPGQIEDAYATERYAFELKLAPVRLERSIGGTYHWGVEPEVAFGLLPRTHVEVGLPLSYTETGGRSQVGIGGVNLSVLHNFNMETSSVPAFGLRADALVPAGNLAPDHWYGSFTGLATRTLSWARIHANGQYTIGEAPTSSSNAGAVETSRWLGGIAVDKTFPLDAMLVTVEGFARKPLASAPRDVEYTTGAGIRYQLTQTLEMDGGVGRRLNGPEQGWYVTVGTAYGFGLRSFFPGGR